MVLARKNVTSFTIFPESSSPDVSKSENCSCLDCSRYRDAYNSIQRSYHSRWLTISPPDNEGDIHCWHKHWMLRITELLKCSDNLLGVVEFANCRYHLHIVYSRSDPIKEYHVLNQFKKDAQIRVYNGGPKESLHYLMKDADETKLLIEDFIFTTKTLFTIKEFNKKEKRIAKQRVAV